MARGGGGETATGDLPRILQSLLSSTPLCEPASHQDPIAQGKQEVGAVQLLTYLAMRAGYFMVTGEQEVSATVSRLYPEIQSGVCLRS